MRKKRRRRKRRLHPEEVEGPRKVRRGFNDSRLEGGG